MYVDASVHWYLRSVNHFCVCTSIKMEYSDFLFFVLCVPRAEEEARRKAAIAKEAAALVTLATGADKLLSTYAGNPHMPQPDLQKLLDKLKRTHTIAIRIAKEPLTGDDVELKKVSECCVLFRIPA